MPLDLTAVAQGAARDAGGLDVALLGDFLVTVTDAAATGRRLRRRELERYAGKGAEAAAAGVPLRAVVDLYLSASWRLWRELPVVADGSAAQVRAAGLGVLRAADDGVAALAEGFQLARGDLVRRQEAERAEVLGALVEGGSRAALVLDRAGELGVDLASPHAVLLVARDDGFEAGAAAPLIARAERALAGSKGDAQPLLGVREGRLLCVFAAPDRAATELVTGRVAGVLDAVAGGPWRAAVGRAATGPQAVRASYVQAVDSLEVAARLGLPGPVVDAGELAVYRLLLSDRAALRELVVTVLGPLGGARGGAGPLLDTLDAYYASGAVATATAGRLHLSVRAVTYRLQRVEELLGRDPAEPSSRFGLQAAVLGARLLDWPAQSLELPTVGNSGP